MSDSELNRLTPLRALLEPVVRSCLRSSFSLQDLLVTAKSLFVAEAVRELTAQGLEVNTSRLSAATGIRRPEVTKLLAQADEPQELTTNLLARVVGQWRNDAEFSDGKGNPRPLRARGRDSEFHRLVKRTSTTLDPGTTLFEFERRHFVQWQEDRVELVFRQVPIRGSPLAAYQLLGKSVDSLICGVEENLLSPRPITNLHLVTEYDNIVPRFIPTIRRWLLDEGIEFHRKIRNFVSQFDKDVNPELANEQGGGKVLAQASSMTSNAPLWEKAQQ
jgi:hypothetical protein